MADYAVAPVYCDEEVFLFEGLTGAYSESYPETCAAVEAYPETCEEEESYPETCAAVEAYPETCEEEESYPETCVAEEAFSMSVTTAEALCESALEVAFVHPLEDFKKSLLEVSSSVGLFYDVRLKYKSYEKLYKLLQVCVGHVDELSVSFQSTSEHVQEILGGAQDLVYAFGGDAVQAPRMRGECLTGSACLVVVEKRKLEAEFVNLSERKNQFWSFVHESLYPFVEHVGEIVSSQSGFITLGYLMRFVSEGLGVVHRLETCGSCLHKGLYRTMQSMDYSIRKYRDGPNGGAQGSPCSHLDTSDSETEPEDALDIAIVRKKRRL
jgi:hypothetical protein